MEMLEKFSFIEQPTVVAGCSLQFVNALLLLLCKGLPV